jgi:cobalt-zinc-cadmium efflux system membrane fusion protein
MPSGYPKDTPWRNRPAATLRVSRGLPEQQRPSLSAFRAAGPGFSRRGQSSSQDVPACDEAVVITNLKELFLHRNFPLRFHAAAAGAFSAIFVLGALALAGCGHSAPPNPADGAPPEAKRVVMAGDDSLVHLDHPEQFPTIAASRYQAASTLNVTGQVTPDISEEIPVVSIANGRVVAIHVHLGDYVHKGQLVLEVQSSDVSNAYDQYLKTVNDERLARTVLERDQLLYSKGAIAKSQVEIAQDGEDDAAADLRASEEQLKFLGINKNNPGATVKVYAPASGFVIQQNVTDASAAGNSLSGSPNAFVIADLSHVWVMCDVYESDLSNVQIGQQADIHLTAYPTKVITGKVGEIGAELDPTLRTAKVRIQVPNPGFFMRVGMFATATLHGRSLQVVAAVPANAILHLHDRDWVYVPAAGASGQFRRIPIQAGLLLPGNMQEVTSGIDPGQLVVRNALELQNTAAQ